MWKTLTGLVRDLFDLNRRVKRHDGQIDDLFGSSREMSAVVYQLSERVLRLDKLEHLQQRQKTERENFRLQLENLVLRFQRNLPPRNQADEEEN